MGQGLKDNLGKAMKIDTEVVSKTMLRLKESLRHDEKLRQKKSENGNDGERLKGKRLKNKRRRNDVGC
jgi:hypothetical protein